MAEETKFIKLNKDVTSEEKLIFAKDSTLKMLVEPSKSNPLAQCLAISAKDEINLPYPTDNDRIYSIALKKEDYTETEPMEKVSYSIPFGLTNWGLEDDKETMDLGLDDAYAQKDYKIDGDGNILTKEEQLQKQASLEKKSDVGSNQLTDSNENISTAFENKVEGQDDPSYSEPWTADESEKPATPPILGELTGQLTKVKNLFKETFAGMEDNNLTETNKDITTDFDTTVGGAGEVKDVYKEDTKEMPWKDENLGQTSAQKKTAVEGNIHDVQPIRDAESNADSYEEDDFPIDASILGLTPEQEAEVNRSVGLEEGDENRVSF